MSEEQLVEIDFDPFAEGELLDAATTTSAQREIWVACQMGDDASLAYNESITMECRGAFDVAAMTAAIQELPRRHEALRSTFSRDGKALCVAASTETQVVFVDASGPGADERAAALVREEANSRFDLEKGPLFRATILRAGPEDHRVIIGAHHIVCDGWSFAVLLKDLAPLYNAKKSGTTPKLDPVHAYSDYARLEEARDSTKEEQYWMGRFEPLPRTLDLPTDRPRPAYRSIASERIDLALDSDLVLAVKKASGKQNVSFFVTLFTAFNVFMGRLAGQQDVVVGIAAAGQSATDREMLVGHCANLLPVRARFSLEQPLHELLREVKTLVLDAYDHQRFTLGDVYPRLKLPRDPSRLPLVSILFNLDAGMEGPGLHFDGFTMKFRANPRVADTFEIFINAFDAKDGVVLECQYATALWDAPTIVAWLWGYQAMLKAFVDRPDTPCGELPMPAGTRARADDVLVVAGHTLAGPDIDQKLREHPALTDGAVALVAGRLTAFVVVKPRETVTSTDLRRQLRAVLPEGASLHSAVELQSLPRTASGAIDRAALAGGQRRAPERREAATDGERLVATIVEKSLRTGAVNMLDNFFDLGGDSMSSIEVVAQIEERTGIRLKPRMLLLSSLADVAGCLADRSRG